MITDKKEARDAWVEYLRSGRYTQTTGSLHDEQGMCCLGVACVAYQEVGPGDLSVEICDGVVAYDDCEAALPGTVMDWLGIRTSRGDFTVPMRGFVDRRGDYVRVTRLTTLNDTVELSFEAIATIVESEPAGMFVE